MSHPQATIGLDGLVGAFGEDLSVTSFTPPSNRFFSRRAGSTVRFSALSSTLNAMGDRDDLRKFITDLAVVHGKVVLSSGAEADWYVDLRRVTLHHAAAPLVGG